LVSLFPIACGTGIIALRDELESAGLPAQFMLLFDEVWDVVNGVSNALEPLFGLANIQDFFVFHVRAGGSGWPMHRDRGGANPAAGFTPDGMPLSTTVWISLTAASLATSWLEPISISAPFPSFRATCWHGALGCCIGAPPPRRTPPRPAKPSRSRWHTRALSNHPSLHHRLVCRHLRPASCSWPTP
jgi:hypothetical protein